VADVGPRDFDFRVDGVVPVRGDDTLDGPEAAFDLLQLRTYGQLSLLDP